MLQEKKSDQSAGHSQHDSSGNGHVGRMLSQGYQDTRPSIKKPLQFVTKIDENHVVYSSPQSFTGVIHLLVNTGTDLNQD